MMQAVAEKAERRIYTLLPTMKRFHESSAQMRCIVGPVGSGKTTSASMEIGYYLPQFMNREFGIKQTRWAVIRNTYNELMDTTLRTVQEWFPQAIWRAQRKTLFFWYDNKCEVEMLFRSCDRPDDIKKLKSLELTGYWIDESIEVPEEIKRMLKNRIGRFPRKCPCRFGIETTNPPDVEHPTYSEFAWDTPPPGPIPEGQPLPNHAGFWQPPRENEANLRPNYYADLANDYKDYPDWLEMYIDGKPGIIIRGKLIYHNFKRDYHVAKQPLIWAKGPLYRGWDNSGNVPACVVVQVPRPNHIQLLKEFHSDRLGIVDFTNYVQNQCNLLWPNAEYEEWGDPAGENEYSKRGGGFTSNAKLMRECGVNVKPSEQNIRARIEAVDQSLARIEGLVIDPSCIRIINGFLGGYCYKPDVATTGEERDAIMKNRFSHPHDALQYVLVRLTRTRGKSLKGPYHPPPRRGRMAKRKMARA